MICSRGCFCTRACCKEEMEGIALPSLCQGKSLYVNVGRGGGERERVRRNYF